MAGGQECAEDMPFARTETFSPKLEEMMNCCIGCALPCVKRCDRTHAPSRHLGGHDGSSADMWCAVVSHTRCALLQSQEPLLLAAGFMHQMM